MVIGIKVGGSLDLQGAGLVYALFLERASKDLHTHGAMISHNYLQFPMPSMHNWASLPLSVCLLAPGILGTQPKL